MARFTYWEKKEYSGECSWRTLNGGEGNCKKRVEPGHKRVNYVLVRNWDFGLTGNRKSLIVFKLKRLIHIMGWREPCCRSTLPWKSLWPVFGDRQRQPFCHWAERDGSLGKKKLAKIRWGSWAPQQSVWGSELSSGPQGEMKGRAYSSVLLLAGISHSWQDPWALLKKQVQLKQAGNGTVNP